MNRSARLRILISGTLMAWRKRLRLACSSSSFQCIVSLVLLAWMHRPILAQSGQSTPSDTGTNREALARVPLTLHEAVQLALKQNPQEMVARIQVEQRKRESSKALASLLPQAAIDSKITVWRYNVQSFAGGHTPNAVGPFQVLDSGGSFSQAVLNIPLIRNYQGSKQNIVTAQVELSGTREGIVSAVVTSYLLVLRAKATLDSAHARRELAQRLFDQAAQLQKTGVGTSLDTLRANVELQNEMQREIDALSSVETASYVLDDVLNLPPDKEIEAVDAMEYNEIPTGDEDALVQRAYRQRPELLAVASEQRAASLETKAASEQRLPSVTFQGTYFEEGRVFSNSIPSYLYVGTLHVPLWTSGRISAKIAEAKLEEQRLGEEKRTTTNAVLQQVRTAIEQLRSSRSAVKVANNALDLAKQEVAQAERRFAAGISTNIEVTTAQDELARASDNQIEALYRYNQSRADLARATGDAESVYGH
jgi:outer membrane protein